MIIVKYFASLKNIAGKEEDRFDLANGSTLNELCQAISKTNPQLGKMVQEKKVMISVNLDVVSLDHILNDGDEVALLPPFSGGI
ncbi:MAG: molybdopterin synthase sulfur carrier subunit [Nitrospinae bacterium CG11_big_fil_rev_8_21_14_0_20_45_15]|nr:MAG: molybdopterin synthase sulfur carrier subunit [Nitrospinae bacterium CG11_big_fil_rev_8_21_14_0_20_45_15]